MSVLDNIPDTNVVVFVQQSISKSSELGTYLQKHATIRSYPQLSPEEVRAYISEQLPHMESAAVRTLAQYKEHRLPAIEQDIRRLGTYKPDTTIRVADVERFTLPTGEANIF